MNTHLLNPTRIIKKIFFSFATISLTILWFSANDAHADLPLESNEPKITEFWLVDTDSDTLVKKINDLDVLSPTSLPENFTLMAKANSVTESVRFGLNDDYHYRVENAAPYSLSGDDNGNYFPIELDLGWHMVRAVPFGADDTEGMEGQEQRLRFALLPNKIVVDTPKDGHDAISDGFCSTVRPGSYEDTYTIPSDFRGSCTLRAAIEESNQRPGIQTIEIPNFGIDIILTLGRLEIKESVFITGKDSPVISGQNSSSVFYIKNSTWVSIAGVEIAYGNAGFAGQGGGIYVKNSFLQLLDTTIRDSRANFGGGLFVTENSHLLTQRTTFKDNEAGHPDEFGGGGITQRGGAISIYNSTARIEQTGFIRNRAVRGGGLSIVGSHIEMINSSLLENEGVEIGGGFEISNGQHNEARVDIAFSTIAMNLAGTSVNANNHAGGGFYNHSGEVRIGNSIIAENETPLLTEFESPDCYSTENYGFISYRGNAIGVVNEHCNLKDSVGGATLSDLDQIGTEANPLDVGLGNFPSETPLPHVMLTSDSIAIDKGNGTTSVTFFKCPKEDIKGNPRPVGEACDAGSYERQY